MKAPLTITPAPHLHRDDSVPRIMWQVVVALMPVCVFSVYLFGLAALVTLTAAILSCVAAERFFGSGSRRPVIAATVATGLIYGLTLPPGLPVWMVVVGGLLAIGVGKLLFGGLGNNPFNPALVGRVFLQAAFPAAMTAWLAPLDANRFWSLPASTLTAPLTRPDVTDAMTGATPLAHWKFEGETTPLLDLAVGTTAGSLGETSAVLLMLGGLYLVAQQIVNWRIPIAICGTVAIITAALHVIDAAPSPTFMLLSGGLMLGAWFMATDPVGSPVTATGAWTYGAVIGALIVAMRLWSGQPESVMYAILIGNAVTPHLDRWLRMPSASAPGHVRRSVS